MRVLKNQIGLVFVFALLSGCSKSDSPEPAIVQETKVLISNEDSSGGGIISTLKNPGGLLSAKAYSLPVKTFRELIGDMQVYNDKVYMVRQASAVVEVANLSDLSTVRTFQYASPIQFNVNKHLVVHSDKIIIADRDYISRTGSSYNSYLKIIPIEGTKTDSVSIVKDGPITALAADNGKIFLSAGNVSQSIYVLDVTNYSLLNKFSFGGFCTDLMIDKDGNLLAFGSGFVRKYNTSSYSLIKEKQIGNGFLNQSNDATNASTGFALDRENNIVYFLASAPQPASAPYLLNSYNIETDELKLLTQKFVSAVTIAFDLNTQQIVIGDTDSKTNTGIIRLLSKTAELNSQISIPGPPSAIRIN